VTLLDVQIFEVETFLHFVELVGYDFLEADSLVVEEGDDGLVVATVAEGMKAGAPLLVDA